MVLKNNVTQASSGDCPTGSPPVQKKIFLLIFRKYLQCFCLIDQDCIVLPYYLQGVKARKEGLQLHISSKTRPDQLGPKLINIIGFNTTRTVDALQEELVVQ